MRQEEFANLPRYSKQVEFDGKTWNIDVTIDNGHHVGHIVEEPSIIFQAIDEADVYTKSMAMLKMWKKHNTIWGMKRLKMKQFYFKPFGHTLNVTLITPYASRAWLWMWYKSKNVNSFTLRIFGVNVYWAEKNAREKLNQLLIDRYEDRINKLEKE